MQRPTINIIGAGKLGKTLARLVVIHNGGTIQGLYNTAMAHAKNAVNFVGQGQPFADIAALPSADITFITTPDDVIAACCEMLSQSASLKHGSLVVHCCAAWPATLLNAVKRKNCLIASVHPMRSFTRPDVTIEQYHGTYCAMEGDDAALIMLTTLFNAIGSIPYRIASDKKGLYHAAGVFASNYLVTLFNSALNCLNASGVEEGLAKQIILSLMNGTCHNIEATPSAYNALTGPIQRGDIDTITKHLSALGETPQLLQLYKTLAQSTLDIANLSPEREKEIKILL